MNCYVWSIALYGAETVALRNVDQKYFEFLNVSGRRMESSWNDNVRNEVLQ
jgi:hypothetical protein